ncbi:FUSC family protein [Amycolatopsis cihanbeyliensis]|uniref:Putative membrane protein YccC n=1 Tax=Amycolatopsis cihanbeyliensis TaxID=1128664 RepID=A0A542DBY7_AMYCI|nr:FUSC family protein [Amycolatopsis cihanbeyliensis]TQJ00584.1 putative membrane protein YccC [Amycolatopsis cihanbeyliensis]
MIRRVFERGIDRLLASDPGLIRLRVAASAVLGIVLAVGALAPFGLPLPIMLIAAIGAMTAAFTVSDPTPGGQAVTLLLGLVAGSTALTAASLGAETPPLDGIVFVLLIFVAVYAQRFGPRGVALGSMTFFLFFFAMFLGTHLGQVPVLVVALATGLAANALVRFVLLRRRAERELLDVRRAFRARLGAVVRAAAAHLAGSGRGPAQLRRADSRLHECVLMIEDTAEDVIDAAAAGLLRRRAIEVELAAQWLSVTARRTTSERLTAERRAELVAALRRLRSLIERDPRELPLISETAEFSEMLVEGSRLGRHAEPGDELRRAIAELALADVNAQRIAERDYSAEEDQQQAEPEPERTAVFAYDNQTRSAIQAVAGGGLAVLGGELVSPQRWYWAVLTVFVVFIGSATAGATFVKGARRLAGTVVGIFGGVLAALLAGGDTPATVALILLCVFAMVYTSRVSQALMAFFITSMLGLLYSLLGTFSFGVLWLRLAETAVGAVAGVLAAMVIVPVRTRAVMLDDIAEVLTDLDDFLRSATALLAGTENVSVIERSRSLDRAVARVRATMEPLTHPVNISSRRDYGWYVLTTLETIAFRARHVAARAQPGLLAGDENLSTLTGRIGRNVEALLATVRNGGGRALSPAGREPPCDEIDDAGGRSVLSSLSQLDAAVLGLGKAFDLEVGEAQSVQHGVRRHTRSAQVRTDSIQGTHDPVSRRTQ